MLGMKNHFDISGSIEIRQVDIAGVACIDLLVYYHMYMPQLIAASKVNVQNIVTCYITAFLSSKLCLLLTNLFIYCCKYKNI